MSRTLISILLFSLFLVGSILANHNLDSRLHITYNGLEHDTWLPDDCPAFRVLDEPRGCSLLAPYVSNTTNRMICSRTCTQLTPQQVTFLTTKLKNDVKIEVRDHAKSSVTCHLKWNRFMFLHGFDLKIEYIWIDHLWTQHDLLELVRCDIHPIQSLKPLKEGDSFYASRTLTMKHRVTVWEQVGSIMLFLLGILLFSCCCAGIITFICLSACKSCRDRRRKRNIPNLKNKKESSIYPNSFEQGMVDMNETQPMYIPYYMLNSPNYAVPVPLQPSLIEDREERTYQYPDIQGGNVINQ